MAVYKKEDIRAYQIDSAGNTTTVALSAYRTMSKFKVFMIRAQ